MNILKTSIAFCACIAATAICSVSSAQKIQDELQKSQIKEDAKGFMAAKLDHTKKIVEGLALENFDAIADNAQKLILLSNETNWRTFQTEKYLDLSEEFRNSADRLRGSAKEKSLDGSTLAFFEVTMNCVRCHKYVRRTQHDLGKKKDADGKRDRKKE